MSEKKLTARELREKGRKKCWSPSQRFWMEVSLYLTTPLARTPITPNTITIIWIIIELFAAFLLLFGDYKLNVIAIILFNFIAYLGDHFDGNLARMKKQFSLLGPYLEQLGIFFGTPLIFLGLAIGNYSKNQEVIFLIISVCGVIFWIFEKLIRINPAWFGEKNAEAIRHVYAKAALSTFRSRSKWFCFLELFRRGQPFNVLFFCIIFNYPQLASLVYSFFFMLEFFRKLGFTIYNLRTADSRK